MCDSAIIRDGVLVLESGTRQPRPAIKGRVQPTSIAFESNMATIVANLMDIQEPLPAQLQDALRELATTATHR